MNIDARSRLNAAAESAIVPPATNMPVVFQFVVWGTILRGPAKTRQVINIC